MFGPSCKIIIFRDAASIMWLIFLPAKSVCYFVCLNSQITLLHGWSAALVIGMAKIMMWPSHANTVRLLYETSLSYISDRVLLMHTNQWKRDFFFFYIIGASKWIILRLTYLEINCLFYIFCTNNHVFSSRYCSLLKKTPVNKKTSPIINKLSNILQLIKIRCRNL